MTNPNKPVRLAGEEIALVREALGRLAPLLSVRRANMAYTLQALFNDADEVTVLPGYLENMKGKFK